MWRDGTRGGAKLVTKRPDKEKNAQTATDCPPGRERTMLEKDARSSRYAVRVRNGAKGGLRVLSIVLSLGILALAVLSPSGEASGVKSETRTAEKSTTEFAVYALSRGKGVPEPTRSALRKAHSLIEGARQRGDVVRLKETRIGLEGDASLRRGEGCCRSARACAGVACDGGKSRVVQCRGGTLSEEVRIHWLCARENPARGR